MNLREAAGNLLRAVSGTGEFPQACMDDPCSVVAIDALTGVVLGVRREARRLVSRCPVAHIAGRAISVVGAIYFAAEMDY